MIGRRDVEVAAALAVVLGIGLAFRLVFWYGLVNVDPFAYADAAESLARGQPVFDPDAIGALYYTQYLRLSLILPAGLAYWAFGPGESQSIAFPLICSLGTGLVAFGMATHVSGDRWAGVLACLIAVVFPEAIVNSTQFLPDTVLAFFSGVTILCFWCALDCDDQNWRKQAVLFGAAGAAWALAFYSRQTAVGLAIPLGLLTLYYRQARWTMLGGVVGALFVGVFMSVVLLTAGGELFEDIRTVVREGRGSQPGALGYTDLDLSYSRLFLRDGRFVPLGVLSLVGAGLVAATWRDHSKQSNRRFLGLLLICVGLFVYFEFFMRLPTLYSWWKEPRYVLTLVAPLSAVSAIGLTRWVRMFAGRTRRVAILYSAAALALLVVLNVRSVRADHAYWEQYRIDATARQVAAVLGERPEQLVYFWDDDLGRYLSFHVGLDRTTQFDRIHGRGYLRLRFDQEGNSLVTPGSLVVVSPGQLDWPKPTSVPRHWQLVWGAAGATQVWSVPAQPEAVALVPRGIEFGEASVLAFGTSDESVLPGQHVVVSLSTDNRSADLVNLDLSVACAAGDFPVASVQMSPGSQVITRDVAINVGRAAAGACTWKIGRAAANADLAPLQIGKLVFIEPEEAFSHDPGTEVARGNAWYRFDQPFYSAGGSAVALRPFSPLVLSGDSVEGDVWVDLGAYDYGSGTNFVAIELNGVVREVSWGGERVGVVHRSVAFRDVPPGGRIAVSVLSAGQDGVTIDSLALTTIPPPR